MSSVIGIRHESKYKTERRTPLTPSHIKQIGERENIDFSVQTSAARAYTDDEFKIAGATIVDNLNNCDIIMGVKEIPLNELQPEKTYIFFSHVIKGQPYNMPMLRRMMELKCNLIDYERVVDDQNRRLIFFGRFAGLAGMINSLWTLGQKLAAEGYSPNPFAGIKQAHQYASVAEAKKAVELAGKELEKHGITENLLPVTIGFTGYGNVSKGAQEIVDLLPVCEVTPGQLLTLKISGNYSAKVIYKVVFREEHISRHKIQPETFDVQHYYNNPGEYENNLELFIPHLTVLMNCMYWDHRYPRVFTRNFAHHLFKNGNPKIKVVGDITCDPEGSIEFTHQPTTIENPVFIYDPWNGKATLGLDGKGIAVMAVDILPSELPRDASDAFGDALLPFIKSIADADFSVDFDDLELPAPIKRAMILHKGALTQGYTYINEFLAASRPQPVG